MNYELVANLINSSGIEFEKRIVELINGYYDEQVAYQTKLQGNKGDGGIDIVININIGLACFSPENKMNFLKNGCLKFENDFRKFFSVRESMWNQIKKFIFITSYNDAFPAELISKKNQLIEEFNFDIEIWNLKDLINKYVKNPKNTELLLIKETFKKCIFNDMEMRNLFEERSWHASITTREYKNIREVFYLLDKYKFLNSEICEMYKIYYQLFSTYNENSEMYNGYYKSKRDRYNGIIKEVDEKIEEVHKLAKQFYKKMCSFIFKN